MCFWDECIIRFLSFKFFFVWKIREVAEGKQKQVTGSRLMAWNPQLEYFFSDYPKLVDGLLFVLLSGIQHDRGEVRTVGGVGEVLALEADG